MKTIVLNALVLFSVLSLSACNIGNLKNMTAAQQMGEVFQGAQELNENMEKYNRAKQAVQVVHTVNDTVNVVNASQQNNVSDNSVLNEPGELEE